VRVISGTARGKRLKAPRGMDTRPITDMIKEALFNVIGNKIIAATLLDLFAGSGSVGIEALSRGAQMVIFIDNNINSVQTIRENLSNCGFKENFELYRNDVFRAIAILDQRKIKFDYIYADPPFTVQSIFSPLLKAIDQSSLLASEGILIIRSPRKMNLTAKLSRLQEYRFDNYGESTLHYYRLNKEVISE
jgi:16S rRNA (guanine(966)-N(2))-methyltransferase RsmD